MQINFDTLSPNQRYHLLTQTVIPRPIAWVLSENDDQSLNLAPFSFFNAICSDPALLMLSIGHKEPDVLKDTARNILTGRDFVVHIASTHHAEKLTKTSSTLAYGASEIELAELELTQFEGCPLPRLSDCHIVYQCALYEHHEIGPGKQAVIYAKIKQLYSNDEVTLVDGKRVTIDADKIASLSRLGAAEYATTGPVFSIKRPK